jgi:hypothetical protein
VLAQAANIHIGAKGPSQLRILSSERDGTGGLIDSNHAQAVFVSEGFDRRDVGRIGTVHSFELLVRYPPGWASRRVAIALQDTSDL